MTELITPLFLHRYQLPALFGGFKYEKGGKRVICSRGCRLNRDQFNSYFSGFVFALDDLNENVTRDAWDAFKSIK